MKEPSEMAKHQSKKDTKKWCKGKVGVEHKPKCMVFSEMLDNSRALVCTECGKRLAVYLPIPWITSEEDTKPDWVNF